MKTLSVIKKLSRFKSVSDEKATWYYSRKKSSGNDRLIKVIDQGSGKCFAAPVFQDNDGDVRVAFHATTIKSLVEFLERK